MKRNSIDFHQLINTNFAARQSELKGKKSILPDIEVEVVGLEDVFVSPEWHKWVYGGGRRSYD